MKKVFLITLNYKHHSDTLGLLDSLLHVNQETFSLNTLVIDNYPKDSIKIDLNLYKSINLEIIYNEKNLGFSGGSNIGINYALKNEADYILIQNNDTLVDKNYILELIKSAEKNNSVGAAVPKIYFAKGFEFHKKEYEKKDLGKIIWFAGGFIDWNNILGMHRGVDEVDRGQYNLEEETKLATGCCVLFPRSVLEKVRGYDEKYFLYYEDSDISQKLIRNSLKIIYNPNSVIWHKNAQSTGGSGSNLQDYFITRNRLLFGMRYAGIRAKAALIKESIILLSKGRKWQKRGIIDFYLRRFGKGSYPLE